MPLGKTRKQSPEIRDSLLFVPGLSGRLSSQVIWSKFDLLVTVVDNSDVQWLEADLWDHDRITLTDLNTNLRVFGVRGAVKVPKMTIMFPVSLVN